LINKETTMSKLRKLKWLQEAELSKSTRAERDTLKLAEAEKNDKDLMLTIGNAIQHSKDKKQAGHMVEQSIQEQRRILGGKPVTSNTLNENTTFANLMEKNVAAIKFGNTAHNAADKAELKHEGLEDKVIQRAENRADNAELRQENKEESAEQRALNKDKGMDKAPSWTCDTAPQPKPAPEETDQKQKASPELKAQKEQEAQNKEEEQNKRSSFLDRMLNPGQTPQNRQD
jgi:hypothetical protein